MRAVVDLPDPDSPTTATVRPAATWILTSSTARKAYTQALLAAIPTINPAWEAQRRLNESRLKSRLPNEQRREAVLP